MVGEACRDGIAERQQRQTREGGEVVEQWGMYGGGGAKGI
jgi:hypothetical protein